MNAKWWRDLTSAQRWALGGIGLFLLACLIVLAVQGLSSNAQAAESCVRYEMPPDVHVACDMRSGMLVWDSDSWPTTVLPTGVRCARPP